MKTRHTILLLLAVLFACDSENEFHRLTVVNGNGSGDYKAGQKVIVTAMEPPEGMFFNGWGGEVDFLEDAQLATTNCVMPGQDVTVEARFQEIPTYDLTVVNGSGSGVYEAGVEIAVAADPAPVGKAFARWSGDTLYLAATRAPQTTFTMPEQASRIEAVYEALPTYPLTVTNGSGSGEYLEGTIVAISADTPPEGAFFVNWTGDVAFLLNPGANTTQVTMPARAVAVTAYFEVVPTYILTVEHGTGSGEYPAGEMVTITASPGADQEFLAWTGAVEYLAQTEAAETQVTMPEQDITVTATFETVSTVPSFANEVFPIIELRCLTDFCHSAISPEGSLETYEDIAAQKSQVKNSILTGDMPQSGFMPQEEIDLVIAWIDASAPNN